MVRIVCSLPNLSLTAVVHTYLASDDRDPFFRCIEARPTALLGRSVGGGGCRCIRSALLSSTLLHSTRLPSLVLPFSSCSSASDRSQLTQRAPVLCCALQFPSLTLPLSLLAAPPSPSLMSRSIPPLHLDHASFADPAAPLPPAFAFQQQQPTLAGAYSVGGVIGVGTYGEVRYAVNVVTGERVAIKIVDLARFSRETAGLMRKEIAILRLLGSHPHCIRIIEVHENVPFAGKWCESCACTRFKRRTEEKEQQEAAAAAGAAAGPSHPARPAHPTKRPPLVSSSPCATCSHSAAEHSGVSYQHDPSFRAHHTHDGSQQEDDDDEDSLGETRQVMLIVQELGSGGELFSLLAHSGQAQHTRAHKNTPRRAIGHSLLVALLCSGPLPEDVARLYFQQLISGMEHLHSLSIAHRDIKPENLVLNEHFQLKIAGQLQSQSREAAQQARQQW